MITFKDTDLREALRRIYANTPTLPADFMEKRKLTIAVGHLGYSSRHTQVPLTCDYRCYFSFE